MEPTQQSLPQPHRRSAGVHSRRSSITRPRDFWLTRQCMHITSFIYAHTTQYAYTQLGYAYTQFIYLCMHPTTIAHTPYAYKPIRIHAHMHTHPYACTSICKHITLYAHTSHDTTYLDLSIPTESLTVITCIRHPAACWQSLLLNDSVFLIFVPWS